MLELRASTPSRWVEAVLDDFDTFLVDHAACERKASATAISLVTHYPDRRQLVRAMIELAREELEHFHRVYRLIEKRGLVLTHDRKDPYLGGLRAETRTGRENHFLDRLLIGGIVEARGAERFGLVAVALPDGELAHFYAELSRSEGGHHSLFIGLAVTYFGREPVAARLDELLNIEAAVMSALPIVAAVH